MTVLAIETSTSICGAALIADGERIAEQSRNEPQIHSEQLLNFVDRVLTGGPVPPITPDAIAVSIGPGSFTGLRIGLSVAKGLSFAWKTPIIPVPTLTALAWNCKTYRIGENNDYILPMIDARRNEVYSALYREQENEIKEIVPAQASTLQQCFELIQYYQRVIVLGDAVEKFRQWVSQHASAGPNLYFPPSDQQHCSAVSVGFMGEQLLATSSSIDIAAIEPMYIKEFVTSAQLQHKALEHGLV